jgi:hypothetical protein
MNTERLADGTGTVAGIETTAGLSLLMVAELRLSAKLGAPSSCDFSSGIGTRQDAVPLVLSQRTREGDKPAADGRG